MSPFFKQISIAFSSHTKAWKFIKTHKLWHFFVWPLLFSLIVFWIGDYYINEVIVYAGDFISNLFGETENADPGFWEKSSLWVMRFLLKILFFYLYYSFNKYLIFIFLSPALAFITEKVEQLATGKDFPFDLKQFIKDVCRGIGIAIRNITLEYLITFAIFIITLIIPPLVIISPIAVFCIQSYFYGFSFLDYSSERRKMSLRESVLFIRKNKWTTIGIGAIFSFLFLIPFLGGIVGPVLSSVAATLAYLEIENEEKKLKPHS